MSSGEFKTLLLSSFEASVSVLLTLGYGILATRLKLITGNTSKDISQLCVNMFLPALLITNVGSELKLENFRNYIPVFLWALIYPAISLVLIYPLKRIFKLPDWVLPACVFNNTTSLPLLLTQALSKTNALDGLVGSGSSVAAAVARANSYFLINSMVSNVLTFAFGPKLFNQSPEDMDEESSGDEEQNAEENPDEYDPLLPKPVTDTIENLQDRIPDPIQDGVAYISSWFSPTLIGAIIAMIIGLTPPIQHAVFEGALSAWLTSSLRNIGELFTALQMFVVGSKLHSSMFSSSGVGIPKGPLALVFMLRFVVWGALSVPFVYLLATKGMLGEDPMLWWALCLMPVGPPAMLLGALTDVANMSEKVKMQVARLLTYMYAVSPVIFVVVGAALKACQKAIEANK